MTNDKPLIAPLEALRQAHVLLQAAANRGDLDQIEKCLGKLVGTVPDIDLRWTLRDILADRALLLASQQDRVDELVRRGWAEMRGDRLAITQAGIDALEVY